MVRLPDLHTEVCGVRFLPNEPHPLQAREESTVNTSKDGKHLLSEIIQTVHTSVKNLVCMGSHGYV